MSDRPAPDGFELVRQPWPPVAGRPGLTQGRYGEQGNLELVAPAVDDGLWVGWFNLDAQETWSGAAVGAWSGALKFASGHQYVSADVTQVDAGPDFLEVVALTTGGTVRRHVWSPGPGFVDHGDLASGVATCAAMVQGANGSLSLTVARPDGRLSVLSAKPASSYPDLTFAEATPPDGTPALLADAAEAVAEVRVLGRIERHVVTRRGTRLWHRVAGPSQGGANPRTDTDGQRVEARVWRR